MKHPVDIKRWHRLLLDICSGIAAVLAITTLLFCISACIHTSVSALIILPISTAPLTTLGYYGFIYGRKPIRLDFASLLFTLGAVAYFGIAYLAFFKITASREIPRLAQTRLEFSFHIFAILLFLLSGFIFGLTARSAHHASSRYES